MNRRINQIALLATLAGLGGLGAELVGIVELPLEETWAQVVAVVVVVLAWIYRALPDLDGDGRPDIIERLWQRLGGPVALVLLVAVGCGGSIEPPEVTEWELEAVGSPAPESLEADLTIEWLTWAVIVDYDQRLAEPFTSGLCVSVLNDQGARIYRACGQCSWGEDDCRLTRQPVIAD